MHSRLFLKQKIILRAIQKGAQLSKTIYVYNPFIMGITGWLDTYQNWLEEGVRGKYLVHIHNIHYRLTTFTDRCKILWIIDINFIPMYSTHIYDPFSKTVSFLAVCKLLVLIRRLSLANNNNNIK